MTKAELTSSERVQQGGVFRDVECIDGYEIVGENLTLNLVNFPLTVVLTQDCDLLSDHNGRHEEKKNERARLISCIVAPMYNYEHFIQGTHLKNLGFEMQKMAKTDWRKLIEQNKNPRYHYLEFDSDIPIVPKAVVDFKHYFTVHVHLLEESMSKRFVCNIIPVYREDLSQRFASFLSRVGLPGVE